MFEPISKRERGMQVLKAYVQIHGNKCKYFRKLKDIDSRRYTIAQFNTTF